MSNETQTVKNVPFNGDDAAATAIRLAGMAGDDVNATLTVIADAKQEMAGGPLRVMIALRKAFGEELDSFPKPGEKEGNNRDEITVEETVNGETKSRKTTWYTVFADNLKEGASILEAIDHCKRARNPEAIKDGIPQHILDRTGEKGWIDRELNRLTGRRATFRASIKRAMELVFQFNAIENVPNIQAEPIWEEGKEGEDIIVSPKCIVVWQTPEDGKPVKYQEDYTVQTFLKFDAAKAIENGGGFKALENTLARKAKASGAEPKAERRIASLDTFVGVTIEAHSFIDSVMCDRDTANYDKLVKGLQSKQIADETVDAFVELRNYLDDIIKASGLQAKYHKIHGQDMKDAA